MKKKNRKLPFDGPPMRIQILHRKGVMINNGGCSVLVICIYNIFIEKIGKEGDTGFNAYMTLFLIVLTTITITTIVIKEK